MASAHGQAAPAKQLMSEQAFKNVTVLKGIPVDEFMDTMGFIAASTNFNCTDCHVEAESGGRLEHLCPGDSPQSDNTPNDSDGAGRSIRLISGARAS